LALPEALFFAAFGILGQSSIVAPVHWEERLQLAREFGERPRSGVSERTLGLVLQFARVAYMDFGDRARAEELAAEQEELAKRSSDPMQALFLLMGGIQTATLHGQLEAAVEAGERLVAHGEALGSPIMARQFSGAALRALLHLGRPRKL
jgi:hypothetical protein